MLNTKIKSLKIFEFYLGFMFVLTVLRMIQKITTDTGGFASRYLPLIIVSVTVIGCIGYIRQHAILQSWLWKLVSIILGVTAIGLLLFSLYLVVVSGVYTNAFILIMGVVVFFPAILVLVKYAFYSPKIWLDEGK